MKNERMEFPQSIRYLFVWLLLGFIEITGVSILVIIPENNNFVRLTYSIIITLLASICYYYLLWEIIIKYTWRKNETRK